MATKPKSRWEIPVTQADIDRATQNDSMRCVVVQAIARIIPGATKIEVDTQTVRFTVSDERYAYLTPYAVAGYVIAFDAGDTIHPFRFRLYEDQRVPIRSRRRTEAGKVVHQAQDKQRRTKNKATAVRARLERAVGNADALADPDAPAPSPAEVKAIKAELRAAEAEATAAVEQAESVRAAFDGVPQSSDAGRRDIPRVFKTRMRHYGHRVLRFNQDSPAP